MVDDERREFYRVMVRLPVRCLAVAADGSPSLMMVRSVDMSAGVQRDPRGSHVVTLAFNGLDRVTRSSILRRAMEQERRERRVSS
jgi:hypothetical protein